MQRITNLSGVMKVSICKESQIFLVLVGCDESGDMQRLIFLVDCVNLQRLIFMVGGDESRDLQRLIFPMGCDENGDLKMVICEECHMILIG